MLRNAGEVIQLRIEKDENGQNLKNGLTTGKLLDEKIDENEDELSEEHEEEISKSSSLPRNSGKKSPFRRLVDDFKVQRVSQRYKITIDHEKLVGKSNERTFISFRGAYDLILL